MLKRMKLIHADRILAIHFALCILPLIVGVAALAILAESESLSSLGVILFAIGALLSLFVLFKVFIGKCGPLMFLAGALRRGKHDRVSFALSAPRSRDVLAEELRIGAERERLTPAETGYGEVHPIYFGYRRRTSAYFDREERVLLVYSCETLDAEGYGKILSDAEKRVRALEPLRKKKKSSSRLKYGRGVTLVVLSDAIEEAVTGKLKQVRKPIEDTVLLPVGVDCGRGLCFFSGDRDDAYDPTTLARKLALALLFDGKRPTDGEMTPQYLRLVKDCEEKTFGEFLKEQEDMSRESDEDEEELAADMQEGEFRIVGITLYYKTAEGLMSLLFFTEEGDEDAGEDDEEIVIPAGATLEINDCWLNWTGKRSMTDRERAIYFPRMRAELVRRGFTVIVED